MRRISLEALRNVTKVIVHADCADGTMSAAIIRQALPTVQVVPMSYNTEAHRTLKAEPGLLFCDFSPLPKRATEFFDAGTVILDHHVGVGEMVKLFAEAGRGAYGDEMLDVGVSGAVLAYDHVYKPLCGQDFALRNFADLIGVRDTWQKLDPTWEEACVVTAGLLAFPFEHWLVNRPCLTDTLRLLGTTEVRRRKLKVEKALQGLPTFRIGAGDKILTFGVIQGTGKIVSDAAEHARVNGLCDVLIGFTYECDDPKFPQKLRFSCRSNCAFDVSLFCSRFGGGGHLRAAGFAIDMGSCSPWTSASPFQVIRDCVERYWTEQGWPMESGLNRPG